MNVQEQAGARAGWTALAITLTATAVALLVDKTVFDLFHAPTVYDSDLGKLLRVMGFSGTWILLALAVGLQEGSDPARRPVARRRAWLLFWSPTLAGALAEILKIVVRRERPAVHDGLYGFRPWDERTWSAGGLAFPSSHTAVAFGGAAMLARLFPRARWIGFALAAGCAVTRVLHRAHFVSDIVFAAGLGWLVSWLLWRRFAPQAAAALLLLLAVPQRAGAQAQDTARPSACSYERCALNVVPRWNGLAVVRGADEAHVATLGFFLPGSLEGAFAGVPEAEALGRRAVRTRWVATTLTNFGAIAVVAGAARAAGAQGSDAAAKLWMTAGAASLALSVPLQFRADGFLARAAWRYNAQFGRTQP